MMIVRIGTILITTRSSLHDAVEKFGKWHGSIEPNGTIVQKFEPLYAGIVLFINRLFATTKPKWRD